MWINLAVRQFPFLLKSNPDTFRVESLNGRTEHKIQSSVHRTCIMQEACRHLWCTWKLDTLSVSVFRTGISCGQAHQRLSLPLKVQTRCSGVRLQIHVCCQRKSALCCRSVKIVHLVSLISAEAVRLLMRWLYGLH